MDDASRPLRAAALLLTLLDASPPRVAAAPARSGGASRASLATPLEHLAERLGLTIAAFHPDGRRAATLGYLEPGEDLIFLREGLGESVRRFTLAHELGHAILHRPDGLAALHALVGSASLDLLPPADDAEPLEGCESADVAAPPDALASDDETLRPGQAYSARARRESEANAFAAALLLPADRFLAAYLGAPSAGRTSRHLTTRSLAERFGVSEDAALRRLTSLLTPIAGERLDPLPSAATAPTPAATPQTSGAASLDQWQRAAAQADAPALIVAGPGTGKTSTLVGRVAHLVRERGVAPETILALTFSNKAAREMRERLTALLNAEPSIAPIAPARPAVSTIHAFCGDLIRRYAPALGLRPDFRLIGGPEGYFLLRRVATDLALDHYTPLAMPALHFPALLSAISRAKDELADPARYVTAAQRMSERALAPEERVAAMRAAEVARIYAAYQAALAERGDPDFGDLIMLAVRLLRDHPDALHETRARYSHILVDEFQDINRAMGVLLRTLAGPDGALWAVGDADQAIYRFRGASPANLTRFTTDYPTARIHRLRRNYRSAPDVLDAAAAVAGAFLDTSPDSPPRLALDATRAPQATTTTVTLASAPDEAAELAGLAAAIQARQAAGRPLREQAILCRTRKQCQRVAVALTTAGLASRIVAPLLEHDEVKDILSLLSLLTDASGAGLLRAGAFADHAYSRADARALLAAARARNVAPVSLLLTLARDPSVAVIPDLSSEGRQSLSVLGAIIAELRQAPDVATGLARYIFSLTSFGRELLAPTYLSALAATEAPPALHGGARSARTRAVSMAQALGLARAYDEQRRIERAAQPATADTPNGADWPGFLDYVRVALSLRAESPAGAEDTLDTTDDALRILTVHASKGLEFPIVYLPGVADRRFPTQRRGSVAPPPADLSEDEALEANTPSAHLAEEACLFYVALTRARDELTLSYADRYGRMNYRPSPFLKPIEQRLGPRLTRQRWAAAPADPVAVAPILSAADDDEPPPASALEREPAAALQALFATPLRPAAIETYSRCPRQFAYRYVYGLRPREVGLATLRRTVHDTLSALQTGALAHTADVVSLPTDLAAASAQRPHTLTEALELFERHWETALEHERRATPVAPLDTAAAPNDHPASDDAPRAFTISEPYIEMYRRHGRQVVERAWTRLMQATLPGFAPIADVATPTTAPGAATGAARFDHDVTVRVGPHDISLTLDRIEQDLAPNDSAPHHPAADVLATDNEPDAPPTAPDAYMTRRAAPTRALTMRSPRPDRAQPAPMRFVRHKLGAATNATPDLRALLYSLAAQQHGAGAETYHHNLTTGEMERVELAPRVSARLRDQLDALLDGMRSGVYPPRPDATLCQNCPFLFICPQ